MSYINKIRLSTICLLLIIFLTAPAQQSKVRWDASETIDMGVAYYNSGFRLQFQNEGNLVLYYMATCTALFSSNTQGQNANLCVMQGDGNLVIYDNNRKPLWYSRTDGHPGAWLQLQGDGNLVIYEIYKNEPRWVWDIWTYFKDNNNRTFCPGYTRTSPCLVDANSKIVTIPRFESPQPCAILPPPPPPPPPPPVLSIVYDGNCGSGQNAILVNSNSKQGYKVTIRTTFQYAPTDKVWSISAGGRVPLGCTDPTPVISADKITYQIVGQVADH
jgi:hypothetical protein